MTIHLIGLYSFHARLPQLRLRGSNMLYTIDLARSHIIQLFSELYRLHTHSFLTTIL